MSFLGLHISSSGLFTARTALDVTAHNISNANTTGYSRQVAEQRATNPLPTATGKGMIGTGSEVYGINQIRSFYLDTKYWSENTILGEYSVKKTQLSLIESLFNEPSDSGFNVIFNSFYDAINGVVNNADSGEHRSALMQAAVSLTEYFNTVAQSLKKYQRDLNFEIKTKVEEINVIARKIQSLNKQIYKYEMDGSKANDLRDERAKLVDQLSKIVNVEVEEIEVNPDVLSGKYSGVEYRDKSEKHFRVKINGQILVDHFYATELRLVPRENAAGDALLYNPEDIEGLYDIKWANGLDFDITDPNLQGELKGYIDMRDGNNGQNFKGTLDSAVNTGTGSVLLTISNPSRTDLLRGNGILVPNGYKVEYSNLKYDAATNTITIEVDETRWNEVKKPVTNVEIGNSIDYKGIPYYLNRLNEFVRTFARAINEGKDRMGQDIEGMFGGHVNGVNLNGEKGYYFFTYKENNIVKGKDDFTTDVLRYEMITAENFSLSKDLLENISNIAAALDGQGLPSGNGFMEALKALRNNTHLFREGTADSYMNSIVSELGINAKQANMFEETQTNITLAVENRRLAISGVNINEEMVSMIQFQQMYNAAARMISVMDAIYDVTINRMGVS
ncbi:MAG TPA: flagellar hook-associated protein FlgK [Defluviitaleaceae bacterium]|nr:flagellar hook-associated protein FlgK [Defluviitaleaceae bacterium]